MLGSLDTKKPSFLQSLSVSNGNLEVRRARCLRFGNRLSYLHSSVELVLSLVSVMLYLTEKVFQRRC